LVAFQIKHLHILTALLSGALFALRGRVVLRGGRWPMTLPLRWTSCSIDTALLTTALLLPTIRPRGYSPTVG